VSKCLGWTALKRDFILYVVYCIGFALIGLLMAIGWRDFFAASHASVANSLTHCARRGLTPIPFARYLPLSVANFRGL